MKKLLKVILGLATAAAAVAGVVYFLKKVVMKDYLDDYDEDDFDNDLYAEEDDRDYVTLNSDEDSADEEEEAAEDADEDEMDLD